MDALKEWLLENGVNQSRMAEHLGITRQYLSMCICGSQKYSPRLCLLIEAATYKQVPRWALRPDLYERKMIELIIKGI